MSKNNGYFSSKCAISAPMFLIQTEGKKEIVQKIDSCSSPEFKLITILETILLSKSIKLIST